MDPTFYGLGAPTPTKNGAKKLNLRPVLFIAGGALLVVVVLGIIANMLNPNTAEISQRLAYRVDALTTLVKKSTDQIQGDSLRKINADLALTLAGDNAVVQKAIPAVKTTPRLTAIKTEETDAQTTTKLKAAGVNGTFDSAYKTVLLQKIESTRALISELYKKSSNTTLKNNLTTLSTHLKTYYDQLKALQ